MVSVFNFPPCTTCKLQARSICLIEGTQESLPHRAADFPPLKHLQMQVTWEFEPITVLIIETRAKQFVKWYMNRKMRERGRERERLFGWMTGNRITIFASELWEHGLCNGVS